MSFFCRMELMNKEFLKLTKNLVLNPVSAFKQDQKLVTAIDKLSRPPAQLNSEAGILLPDRKLEFAEVQELLKQSSEKQGKHS